jgi:hypothetical protein
VIKKNQLMNQTKGYFRPSLMVVGLTFSPLKFLQAIGKEISEEMYICEPGMYGAIGGLNKKSWNNIGLIYMSFPQMHHTPLSEHVKKITDFLASYHNEFVKHGAEEFKIDLEIHSRNISYNHSLTKDNIKAMAVYNCKFELTMYVGDDAYSELSENRKKVVSLI